LRFEEAERRGELAGFRRFLRLHPQHRLAPKAWRLLVAEQGRLLIARGDRKGIVAFLGRHPDSVAAQALRKKLESLDYDALSREGSSPALESFLRSYPASPSGAAVRKRLEERLSRQVAALGDRTDLLGFKERFPASGHMEALELVVSRREALDALLSGDLLRLRSILAGRRPLAPPAKRRILDSWLQGGLPRLAALSSLFRGAAQFRPRGSPRALTAAATTGDPPTAAFALRALSYLPSLSAARAILERVESPDFGVSYEACRALAAWNSRAPQPAATEFLEDRLAALRLREDTSARVGELGILLAMGDSSALLETLASRSWNRPWSVLPSVLWLERLAPGSEAARRVGGAAVKLLKDELGRLGQMLPKELGDDTKARAIAALFEIGALVQALGSIEARHGRGPGWVGELGGLVESAKQRLAEVRQALSRRYPEMIQVDSAETDQDSARHMDRLKASQAQLGSRIAGLGLSPLVRSFLCETIQGVPLSCPSK
jgi:hypothetical protein